MNTAKRKARILKVAKRIQLSRHMIRIVLTGDELLGWPTGSNGGNIKLFLPEQGCSAEELEARLQNGPKPVVRTYTARHYDPELNELAVDFVVHPGAGPASDWAQSAQVDSILGLAGPSGKKLPDVDAERYIFCADMSAMPAAEAELEVLPASALGDIIFEVMSEEDIRDIKHPPDMKLHWLVQSDPHVKSSQQLDLVKSLVWPDENVVVFVAGETSVVREFRLWLTKEKELPKSNHYLSGYWKIGLVEDQHQIEKRAGIA